MGEQGETDAAAESNAASAPATGLPGSSAAARAESVNGIPV